MGKAKNTIDSTPFIVGVITLLKQFHSLNTQKVLAYLGQYVRSLINATQERYVRKARGFFFDSGLTSLPQREQNDGDARRSVQCVVVFRRIPQIFFAGPFGDEQLLARVHFRHEEIKGLMLLQIYWLAGFSSQY
jgi:hypothetical protein